LGRKSSVVFVYTSNSCSTGVPGQGGNGGTNPSGGVGGDGSAGSGGPQLQLN